MLGLRSFSLDLLSDFKILYHIFITSFHQKWKIGQRKNFHSSFIFAFPCVRHKKFPNISNFWWNFPLRQSVRWMNGTKKRFASCILNPRKQLKIIQIDFALQRFFGKNLAVNVKSPSLALIYVQTINIYIGGLFFYTDCRESLSNSPKLQETEIDTAIINQSHNCYRRIGMRGKKEMETFYWQDRSRFLIPHVQCKLEMNILVFISQLFLSSRFKKVDKSKQKMMKRLTN